MLPLYNGLRVNKVELNYNLVLFWGQITGQTSAKLSSAIRSTVNISRTLLVIYSLHDRLHIRHQITDNKNLQYLFQYRLPLQGAELVAKL